MTPSEVVIVTVTINVAIVCALFGVAYGTARSKLYSLEARAQSLESGVEVLTKLRQEVVFAFRAQHNSDRLTTAVITRMLDAQSLIDRAQCEAILSEMNAFDRETDRAIQHLRVLGTDRFDRMLACQQLGVIGDDRTLELLILLSELAGDDEVGSIRRAIGSLQSRRYDV